MMLRLLPQLLWSYMARVADAFYILDFDRTLADNDKLLEVFLQVADEYIDLPPEQIQAAAADVSKRGDSFDTAGYVRDHLAARNRLDDWDRLEHWYVQETKSLDMLLPGAAELLELLDRSDYRYGMLTYGNPLWQRLKLAAARLNHIPHIIMTTKEKGNLITSWRQMSEYVLPQEFGGGTVEQIILIDDKAASFADFPVHPCRGYWVLPQGGELPSQKGTVPSNVVRVSSLYDVIDIL